MGSLASESQLVELGTRSARTPAKRLETGIRLAATGTRFGALEMELADLGMRLADLGTELAEMGIRLPDLEMEPTETGMRAADLVARRAEAGTRVICSETPFVALEHRRPRRFATRRHGDAASRIRATPLDTALCSSDRACNTLARRSQCARPCGPSIRRRTSCSSCCLRTSAIGPR